MIVLTGATGFVGTAIVERLGREADLLLVSRDRQSAEHRFPGFRICDYASLAEEDLAGAVFVHLAVRNNDRPGTASDFERANVDCLLDVATIARDKGAARFINLCTTHALDPRPDDLYGLSKREGARRLAQWWPEGAVNLYVPAVYAREFRGRLAGLNRLPAPGRVVALALLRQVKPVISIDHLVATLQELMRIETTEDLWRTEHYAGDPGPAMSFYAAAKRSLDLIAAIALIVAAGWAMLLIALYIRFDSKGPALFAQKRVGRDGRVFTCYKFRTMAIGTAHAATHEVSATAVTGAGRFLRRTKLDELPQVFNVLRNDMSLVGPRPCLPVQTELVSCRERRGVLQLKPGITGLAQIADIDMSDPPRLAAWDDRYRAFRTLVGDIAILIRTVLGGGSGDRVASQ